MSRCEITDEDIKELVAHPWPSLESIWLSYNQFGAKAMTYIADHDWPRLVSIHLSTPTLIHAATSFIAKVLKI